jgi:hypothetical protein
MRLVRRPDDLYVEGDATSVRRFECPARTVNHVARTVDLGGIETHSSTSIR